jgi:hypothetical protein
MSLKTTILLLILPVLLSGQSISFIVLDSLSGLPVKDAHITIPESNTGCITDYKGKAVLKTSHANGKPMTINVTHLNYHSFILECSSLSDHKRVLLSPKTHLLPSVSVESPLPVSLTKNKPWFVKDYLLLDSNILVLTYVNQRFSRSHLALITACGELLDSTPLPYATGFYSDALGTNYVLDRNTVWQIHIDKTQIYLIYPVGRELFLNTMEPLIEARHPEYYLRYYSYGRHRAHFVLYNDNDSTHQEFFSISDRASMNMYDDLPRMLSNASEHSVRFELEIMHKPLHAPLYIINDSLYIVNPVDESLHIFMLNGESVSLIKQSLSKDKSWGGDFVVDSKTGRLYSLHYKNGFASLKERRPDNLEVLSELPLPSFPFIENIQIVNETIYFLYKDFTSYEFKQLYCLKL